MKVHDRNIKEVSDSLLVAPRILVCPVNQENEDGLCREVLDI